MMDETKMTIGDRVTLFQGDAIRVMSEFPTGIFDAVVADPPYSSGGFTRGDRTASPGEKYLKNKTKDYPDFAGDSRSQRGWSYWCALWGAEAFRVTKPGGYFFLFTDWRQLASAVDVVEAAGYIFRGIVAWDKTESARAPHKGYFRHQCEYVVWGSSGVLRPCAHDGPFPGCVRIRTDHRKKRHQTGKPVELIEQLIRLVRRGDGVILDPFMGSGTTGVACVRTGRQFVGIEATSAYFDVAREWLSEVLGNGAED